MSRRPLSTARNSNGKPSQSTSSGCHPLANKACINASGGSRLSALINTSGIDSFFRIDISPPVVQENALGQSLAKRKAHVVDYAEVTSMSSRRAQLHFPRRLRISFQHGVGNATATATATATNRSFDLFHADRCALRNTRGNLQPRPWRRVRIWVLPDNCPSVSSQNVGSASTDGALAAPSGTGLRRTAMARPVFPSRSVDQSESAVIRRGTAEQALSSKLTRSPTVACCPLLDAKTRVRYPTGERYITT